jgi:hypothetical protein
LYTTVRVEELAPDAMQFSCDVGKKEFSLAVNFASDPGVRSMLGAAVTADAPAMFTHTVSVEEVGFLIQMNFVAVLAARRVVELVAHDTLVSVGVPEFPEELETGTATPEAFP